jgi:cytochrome c oxidase cbb3-type subunit 3
MSDFFSSGWSIFIALATLVSLFACLVLLVFASRRKPMAGDNSTGHVFDEDLVEMNNPLPLWWVVLFVLTVVFSVVYVYVFPGLGSSPGTLGWTSRGELASDQARVAASMAKVYAEYAQQPITLGRTGMMPPMAAAVGSAVDVRNVANYVMSLSGDPHNPIAAAAGKAKFAACAACHGVGGKGNAAIGAPNLADKVWLHGWGEQAIVDMIDHGKTNVMPAQGGRLTPAQIHLLASYVWSLSQSRQTASR